MALSSDPVLFLSDDFCIARCWSQRYKDDIWPLKENRRDCDWLLMTDTILALLLYWLIEQLLTVTVLFCTLQIKLKLTGWLQKIIKLCWVKAIIVNNHFKLWVALWELAPLFLTPYGRYLIHTRVALAGAKRRLVSINYQPNVYHRS